MIKGCNKQLYENLIGTHRKCGEKDTYCFSCQNKLAGKISIWKRLNSLRFRE